MNFRTLIRGGQHVGIPVSDLTMTRRWYEDALQFELVQAYQLSTSGGIVPVAFLRRAGLVLELYQLPGGLERDPLTAGHIDHLSIATSDVAAAVQMALTHGGQLDPAGPENRLDLSGGALFMPNNPEPRADLPRGRASFSVGTFSRRNRRHAIHRSLRLLTT